MIKMLNIWSVALVAALLFYSTARAESIQVKADYDRIIISGTGLNQIAGIEIDLTYDPQAYRPQTVESGSLAQGSMVVPNLKQPGRARIGVIHPQGMSGAGIIATLRGSRLDAGIPVLISTTVKSSDAKGKLRQLDTTIIQEKEVAKEDAFEDALTPTRKQTEFTSSATNIAVTRVTSTADVPNQPNKKAENPTSYQTNSNKQEQTSERSNTPQSRTLFADLSYDNGILHAFQSFKGERSLENLLEIFMSGLKKVVRQEPPIALSDGQSRIKVYVENEKRFSDNYAIRGGRILSKKTINGITELTVLPGKGLYEVEIILTDKDKMLPLPLVVVPPRNVDLNRDNASDSGDFELLKNKNIDLNGDDKFDYVDEYLFAGNYLLHWSHSADNF